MLRDLFPEPEIVCKNLSKEQSRAVRWFLEWLIKNLEGVELHIDADEKAQTRKEMLSALRFQDSRNKLDKSPPPYIVIWTKLIKDGPSIVKRGCRFALQACRKFLDQVRILIKTKILWNYDLILLSPGAGEELCATFGVKTDALEDSVLIEPINGSKGLRRPKPIQTGMLEFNPRVVETFTIEIFCSMMGRS